MKFSQAPRSIRTLCTLSFVATVGSACGKAEEAPPPAVPVQAAPSPDPLAVQTPAPATAAEPTVASAPPTVEEKIKTALAASHRDDAAKARDAARHPLEVLTFFGLRDDMTVLELAPGGGWYTAVLAPVLKERGKLLVTSIDPAGGPGDKYPWSMAKTYEDSLKANPNVYGAVQVVRVSKDDYAKNWGPDASVDMVLTFRNFHNWYESGTAEKFIKEAHRVLKPGGVFGFADHRAAPGADPKKTAKQGYIPEETVIKLVTAGGFDLAGKSEVNANPKDTRDYPEGVWTLPPSLKLGEKDRAKYVAIGESDRMTLKFVKR